MLENLRNSEWGFKLPDAMGHRHDTRTKDRLSDSLNKEIDREHQCISEYMTSE